MAAHRHAGGNERRAGEGALVFPADGGEDEDTGDSWDGVLSPPGGVPCPGLHSAQGASADPGNGIVVRVAVTYRILPRPDDKGIDEK